MPEAVVGVGREMKRIEGEKGDILLFSAELRSRRRLATTLGNLSLLP
jgi:hypothetical protein